MTKKTITKQISENKKIIVNLRYNDECKNGHNTFSITGTYFEKNRVGKLVDVASGCIHDLIKKHVPEVAHLIKWHLCGESEPMYYFENTLFLAGDTDCCGFKAGEVSRTEKRLVFEGFPVSFKFPESFYIFLKNLNLNALEIKAIYHDEKPEIYRAKYTFDGYADRWHDCPFDTLVEAEEFLNAFKNYHFSIVEIPTEYSEGKKRDLDDARRCAIWPDAPDGVLCLPKEELRQKLAERLPALMEKFHEEMKKAGIWEENISGKR